MKAAKSAWQKQVGGALIALQRQRLHLEHKLGFWSLPVYAWIRRVLGKPPISKEVSPQIEKIEHRMWLISSRYR
ncbi:hypothetical protein LU674_001710 [Pseudomonas alloputida]|uniref:Uncharacterized protein n=1 Tax=Pseudomonas alloputida TaxID=1940621 RepID=A0AAW7HPJ7_9PSED|nr:MULTISPECIES: hypothetical protein [Pseudomonas]MDM3951068.1 hypothetical protein [Pseudomonas alloputida]